MCCLQNGLLFLCFRLFSAQFPRFLFLLFLLPIFTIEKHRSSIPDEPPPRPPPPSLFISLPQINLLQIYTLHGKTLPNCFFFRPQKRKQNQTSCCGKTTTYLSRCSRNIQYAIHNGLDWGDIYIYYDIFRSISYYPTFVFDTVATTVHIQPNCRIEQPTYK